MPNGVPRGQVEVVSVTFGYQISILLEETLCTIIPERTKIDSRWQLHEFFGGIQRYRTCFFYIALRNVNFGFEEQLSSKKQYVYGNIKLCGNTSQIYWHKVLLVDTIKASHFSGTTMLTKFTTWMFSIFSFSFTLIFCDKISSCYNIMQEILHTLLIRIPSILVYSL